MATKKSANIAAAKSGTPLREGYRLATTGKASPGSGKPSTTKC